MSVDICPACHVGNVWVRDYVFKNGERSPLPHQMVQCNHCERTWTLRTFAQASGEEHPLDCQTQECRQIRGALVAGGRALDIEHTVQWTWEVARNDWVYRCTTCKWKGSKEDWWRLRPSILDGTLIEAKQAPIMRVGIRPRARSTAAKEVLG